MFDELIGMSKASNFVIREIVTDKDSSVNAIYTKHFPEGIITYCANHSAKAGEDTVIFESSLTTHSVGLFKCMHENGNTSRSCC